MSSHEELGNAIWSAIAGDTINISSGEYGYLALKPGINYNFAESASVADILGLGFAPQNGNWSAGRIEAGSTTINKPKIKRDNIKMFYVYRQKLPFNSQLPHLSTFFHPNGCLISIFNEAAQESFSVGGPNGMPCDFVEITVPSFNYYDVALVNDFNPVNFEKKAKEIEKKT